MSFLALFLVLAATVSESSETGAVQDFVPLFNGEDLTGWVNVNTAASTWSVRDGMLHCSGKPIGELRTERMYQNFVLEVEWRHLDPAGNAGIFVWADDITARGVPFHRSIEVQVLDHGYGNTKSHTTHGDIFPIHGARMTPINGRGGSRAFPTEERSKPSPQWNHYRITCRDGSIALAVNGKVVTRGEDCSPRKGYICLESEGGRVDYRNLRIAELPDNEVAPEHVATADRGYVSLYDGLGLEGWTGSGFKARDWVLAHPGMERSTLTTKRRFDDVGFIFDVRKHVDASAAVRVRGALIQIDPEHAAFADGWNRFEGELRADELVVRLNGKAYATGRATSATGALELEAAGSVDWANLYVRELD